MTRSSTTTSLWKPTAALLLKICELNGHLTQPQQLDILVRAEADKLKVAEEALTAKCLKCGCYLV